MQKSTARLPRKQRAASGIRGAAPPWGGRERLPCVLVAGSAGSGSLRGRCPRLCLRFCHSPSPSPSPRFCHCHSVSLSFPTPNLTSLSAAPHAEHRGPRLPRGVSARGARRERAALRAERGGRPSTRGSWSPRGRGAARVPTRGCRGFWSLRAPEIVTSATNARLSQSLPGTTAAGGGIRGPGSPKAPASQTHMPMPGTPGRGGGGGEWAAPQAQGHPGAEPPGTEARSFQNWAERRVPKSRWEKGALGCSAPRN